MKKLWILGWLTALLAVPAIAQTAPSATLTWDVYTAAQITAYGFTGVGIQRKAEACAGTALQFTALATATGGATATTYTDTAVATGKTYAWRVFGIAPVSATNPTGNSAFGNCVDKTFPLPQAPAPTNLIVQIIAALIDALQKINTALLNPPPQ